MLSRNGRGEARARRRRPRERDLAAEASRALEQDDLVTRAARVGGRREPGRAAADDDEAPARPRGGDPCELQLAPGRCGLTAQAIGVPAW